MTVCQHVPRWLKERLKSRIRVARYQRCSIQRAQRGKHRVCWTMVTPHLGQSDFHMVAEHCRHGIPKEDNATAWRFDACRQVSLQQQACKRQTTSDQAQQCSSRELPTRKREGLIPNTARWQTTPITSNSSCNSRGRSNRSKQPRTSHSHRLYRDV